MREDALISAGAKRCIKNVRFWDSRKSSADHHRRVVTLIIALEVFLLYQTFFG